MQSLMSEWLVFLLTTVTLACVENGRHRRKRAPFASIFASRDDSDPRRATARGCGANQDQGIYATACCCIYTPART